MRKKISNIFTAVILTLIAYSCANIGSPTGGPKDVTPPKVLGTNPANFSKNFKGGKIEVFFDEFVRLEKMNEQFAVSPPMKKKPMVKVRGKSIYVKLEEKLHPNTTYTLDFGNGIVDNNEGNKLGDFQFVFSTGNHIDSLGISGKVVDAFNEKKVDKVMIMAYKNTHDSVPLTTIPDYIALTDSVGYFKLKNLSSGTYKLFAIVDNNRDYKYNKTGETIGFIDSLVIPSAHQVQMIDTIKGDSIKSDSVIMRNILSLEPSNIYMRMFKEENKQQYLSSYKRERREKLEFVFNSKRTDSLFIDFVGIDEKPQWFLLNKNRTNDTLSYWITDKDIYNRDTLLVALKYLKTDTLGKLVSFNDTLKMNFKSPQKAKVPRKKKKKKTQAPYYKFRINSGGNSQNLNEDITLIFEEPLKKINMDSIHFYRMKDTIPIPEKFQLEKDSIDLLKYHFKCKWLPETAYKLTLDSTTFENIYGLYSKKVTEEFKTKSTEDYGTIALEVSGVQTNTIIQIIGSGDSEKVYQQKNITSNGTYKFSFLNPETYMIKVIEDFNKNGRWDTGNYEEKRLPERVFYFRKEIKLRANWEQIEAIKIPSKPTFNYDLDHQPKHKISTEKKKRKNSNRGKRRGNKGSFGGFKGFNGGSSLSNGES